MTISKFQTLWAIGMIALVFVLVPFVDVSVIVAIALVGGAVGWGVWIHQWRARTEQKPVEKPE